MKRAKEVLTDLLARRDNWTSGCNLWLLAAAVVLPFGLVLPLGRLAWARVASRRSRSFYSN